MKICILSMQQVNNYGSVLQAYSLKKIIESLNAENEVDFLEIERGSDERLNELCALGDISFKKRGPVQDLLTRIKGKISGRKRRKILHQFRTDHALNRSHLKTYDVCVIGSDEVFNCLQKTKWGFSRQLFGDLKEAKTIITYAASCGFTKADMLPDDLRAEIIPAMKNIKKISVRDSNTREFVLDMLGSEPVVNLDPVAIGNFDEELLGVDISRKLPKKYCLVYSYAERISEEKEIQAIKNYCIKYGLSLVSAFGKQKWIHDSPVLSPFEVLKAFQGAECIVTDTFHGAIFGAKFSSKMAILIRESNRNKLEDLSYRLGLEAHVAFCPDDIEVCLSKVVDTQAIERTVKIERERAIRYLSDSLRIENKS